MTLYKTIARAAGLGLCVVAFAGTALADPGKGNGEPPATPPGQEKKAEQQPAPVPTPAPAAAKGQEQKAENQEKKAAKKAAKAAPKAAPANKGQEKKAAKAATPAKKPATPPGQAKKADTPAPASPSKGRSAEAHHHVIVCHRTGSASNPYVVINIPMTAWTEAHSPDTGSHPDLSGRHDILLKDPASGPGSKDGFTKEDCGSSQAPVQIVAPKPEEKKEEKKGECPVTTTTTERVLVGVWHATGATKDGQRKFVFITPSLNSAHYDSSKHPDDVPVYDERTVTVTASAESCKTVATVTPPAPTPPVVPPAPEQPQPIVPTPPGETPAPGTIGVLPAVTPAPVGGVAGAVSPAPEQKDSGGVLGAVASAPEAVAETVTSGTLPFTGIPLWIAALIGGGLLAAGLALRRTA